MVAAPPAWPLGDILAGTLGVTPHATALITGSERRRTSYGELDDQAAVLASALTAHGLGRGDVVAVQAANRAEFVLALLGAARAGLVVVPLDPALSCAETRQRLDMVGARVTLLDADSPTARKQPDGDCPEWALSADGFVGDLAAPRQCPGPEGLAVDDALIMFTSGTTASPKMVPWTRGSVAAAITAITRVYSLTSADSTVAVMPLFHGHGLIAALLATLASGGTVLLPAKGRFSAHTFWDDMAAADATWYTAVPTIHRILLTGSAAGQPDEHRDHGKLRFIRTCSAPLPAETLEQIENAFGAPVLAAYGMTEATHQVSSVSPLDDRAVRSHTVGTPQGVDVRIVDSDGEPCRSGTTGEIWLKGPVITRGYLGGAADGDGAFSDGWLRTGDLGVLDEHNHLAVTGRIKNLINRGGEKISPEHVEEVLTADPEVSQVAVFGILDPMYGERVAAIVVPAAARRPDADRLLDYCREWLAPYEIPDRIAFATRLPLTPKGDIDRSLLSTYNADLAVGEHRTEEK